MSGSVIFEKRAEQGRLVGKKLEVGQRTHSNASLSPTNHDGDSVPNDAEKVDGMDLTRTKSIVETLSLPREIGFVAIVCSAQLLTRKTVFHSTNTSLTPLQKPHWETYRPLFTSLVTTLVSRTHNCHGLSQATLSQSEPSSFPPVASVMSSDTSACCSSASSGCLYGPLS